MISASPDRRASVSAAWRTKRLHDKKYRGPEQKGGASCDRVAAYQLSLSSAKRFVLWGFCRIIGHCPALCKSGGHHGPHGVGSMRKRVSHSIAMGFFVSPGIFFSSFHDGLGRVSGELRLTSRSPISFGCAMKAKRPDQTNLSFQTKP